jgi:hypothetical protein
MGKCQFFDWQAEKMWSTISEQHESEYCDKIDEFINILSPDSLFSKPNEPYIKAIFLNNEEWELERSSERECIYNKFSDEVCLYIIFKYMANFSSATFIDDHIYLLTQGLSVINNKICFYYWDISSSTNGCDQYDELLKNFKIFLCQEISKDIGDQ